MTSVHVTKYAHRSRTSRPGARRKNFFGGSSLKSSRSMYNTRENGTFLVPAVWSSGLLITSSSSTCPSDLTEELLWRVFLEVVALDVQHPGERHLPRAGRLVLGVVDHVELLDVSLRSDGRTSVAGLP